MAGEQRFATVADDVNSVCEMSGISRVSQNRFGERASVYLNTYTQRYGKPNENRIIEDTQHNATARAYIPRPRQFRVCPTRSRSPVNMRI